MKTSWRLDSDADMAIFCRDESLSQRVFGSAVFAICILVFIGSMIVSQRQTARLCKPDDLRVLAIFM